MSNSLSSWEDQVLLKLVQQDNELAFKELYSRYREPVFKFVYNRLRDPEAAAEIVQELFVNLWKLRHTLDIQTSLGAYLHGGAWKNVLHTMRKKKSRKKYAAELAVFMQGAADNSNAEHQAVNDINTIIERELNSMPEKWRLAFRLSKQQHLPIKEVAQQMGIEDKTAYNYLTRALNKLRVSLGEFMCPTLIACLFIELFR